MLQELKTYFGYDAFRPLQEEIITTVLQKKDVLVLMPTGGGKSLCYQLPALRFEGITLVISPLIALMKDQVDSLVANGISAAFLNSSLLPEEAEQVCARALSGNLKILYLAPERLALFDFQTLLSRLRISLIAIDEAHCISEWGHDFRPDYRNLKALRRLLPSVPVIALTATATPQVREDILRELEMRDAPIFLSSFNRPNLHYTVRPKQQAFSQLIPLLKRIGDASSIIYTFSRKDAETLAADLNDKGFRALPYHAGLDRDIRRDTQEKFIRDEVPIIVATIAFGMGIDKPDVRLVVHMDLPKSVEGYYQETGRAGRDGLPSECVLFYSFGDMRKQSYFIRQIEEEQERALAEEKLRQVIRFCELSTCRRRFLLEYFGERWSSSSCGACDACVEQPVEGEVQDATELSHKIFSAILRTGERFGAGHICDVLRGANKKRIREYGHNQLSVYGIARETPQEELQEAIQLLVKKGYLAKNPGEYPTLCMSALGKNALAEKISILLPTSEIVFISKQRQRTERPDFDHTLFQELRRLRKIIADERGVPPFVIFGDRTLQEMAAFFPQRRETLGDLFGVGRTKMEQYGERFLETIRSFAKAHALLERRVPRVSPRSSRYSVSSGDTYTKTKELLAQKHSVSEIARARGMTEGTILQHLEKLKAEDPTLDLLHLRPQGERFQKILRAFQESGQTIALSPVRALLGDTYSYDEIRLARMFLV